MSGVTLRSHGEGRGRGWPWAVREMCGKCASRETRGAAPKARDCSCAPQRAHTRASAEVSELRVWRAGFDSHGGRRSMRLDEARSVG